MKRPSPALVAHWYAKLRAGGFRDIEGGRDLNQLHASTFRGGDGTHGAAHESWPEGFEPRCTLADHPTAIYYRGLERAARELHGKRRRLVMASLSSVSGGSALAARGRAEGMTGQNAAQYVRKLATSIGLVREAQHG